VSGDSLEARFASTMGRLLGPDFPEHIALAVSGGGDSMAMLALAHGWARVMGVRLWVVTVDHGLRAESAIEAAMVAAECAALGHPHATLRWHWDGKGNVQDAARQARLALIDRWRGGIEHVLFAHTQDDVAETFLMRLARGSGVEGLSAMAASRVVTPHQGGWKQLDTEDVVQTIAPPIPTRRVAGVPAYSAGFRVIRPLLRESRRELRHYLDVLKVPYVDDPSNDDSRYDRVKARQALAALAPLGVDAGALAETADRMRRARAALKARAVQVAKAIQRPAERESGSLLFDRDGFEAVERDTQLRLLAAALQWLSGAVYRPRVAPLEDLLDRLLGGGAGTLHGCEARCERAHIRVFREYAAIADLSHPAGPHGLFDQRWLIYGPDIKGGTVRALGPDGWAQIPEKTADAPPFHVAKSMPAVFREGRLLACRGLHFGPLYVAEDRVRGGAFARFLESD